MVFNDVVVLYKFKYYREIDFKNDSEHLILKDNKLLVLFSMF